MILTSHQSLSCGSSHFRRLLDNAGRLRSGTQAPNPGEASPCYHHPGRATGWGGDGEETRLELALAGLWVPGVPALHQELAGLLLHKENLF